MSFFTLLIGTFLIGDILWTFHATRRLPSLLGRLLAGAWGAGMFAGLSVVLWGRFAGVMVDDLLPRTVISAVFIWHLFMIPLWLGWQLAGSVIRGIRRLNPRSKTPAAESGMSRREFLTAATTFAPAVVASAGALSSETQLEEFRVREIDVPIADLPAALEGLSIAQVSDVHVGRFTRGAVLERIVGATNDLKPDLTVLTGDLINFAMRDLPAGIDLVRGMRARHGVYVCEGNHDLFEDAAGFRRQLLRSGVALLRDEAALLTVGGEKVQLFGAPWTRSEAEHSAALSRLESLKVPGAFSILLAHHPHVFDHAGGFPLVFAGHTHGGQIMAARDIGFGPWMFRYWSGLYQKAGRALVVSNGVGNWFPIRIGAPAEIVHATLRRAV